jgi:hypothetical protein
LCDDYLQQDSPITFAVIAVILLAVVTSAYFVISNNHSSARNSGTVTLVSAKLYGGFAATGSNVATSNISFTFSNYGEATYVVYLRLWSSSTNQIVDWDNTAAALSFYGRIYFSSGLPNNTVRPAISAGITMFTWYPVFTSSKLLINTGQDFNYVIIFANGQSITGKVIAD